MQEASDALSKLQTVTLFQIYVCMTLRLPLFAFFRRIAHPTPFPLQKSLLSGGTQLPSPPL